MNRSRRLRGSSIFREAVRETKIEKNSLILPIFMIDGHNIRNPISTLENHYHYSVDRVCVDLENHLKRGLNKFLLFGIPEHKDSCGSAAFSEDGIVNRSLREIKKEFGKDIYLISDVCMCEYTDHGHCGILEREDVHNDRTLDFLRRISLSNVNAGADMVAPSDMMDGRIASIRQCLDENSYENVPIMSYSVKYSSAFYGPFREAAHSAPQFGDRRGYQMDFRNTREAVREVQFDEAEGADIIMVKPALSYLDIISKARETTNLPIAAYSVSGEYAMIKAAAKAGLVSERALMLETVTSIYRAGADILISYFCPEIIDAIEKGEI